MNAVACQAWPWVLHWRRQGAELAQRLDETLAAVAACGYGAWEQDLPQSAGERETLGEGLRRHKLGMPSAYLNAPLHRGDWPAQVEAIALHCREAKVLGLQVLVLNPTPLSWDEALDKSKPEMQAQGAALDQLGAALQGQGQVLAYHIHSAEMRRDAREFRSTLAGTQRSHVGLCLEPQWMFEGAGDETLLRQTCQA